MENLRELVRQGVSTRSRSRSNNRNPTNQPPTSNSTPSPVNMAEQCTNFDIKFTGLVPESDPEYTRYSGFTVHNWLADTENRIARRKLTDGPSKIKEAKLQVHQDKGDARIVLNSYDMQKITSWETFKEKCLLVWETTAEADAYTALVKFFDDAPGSPIANLHDELCRRNQDLTNTVLKSKMMVGDKDFWDGKENNHQLVRLTDIMKYMSIGSFFRCLSPSRKKTFRKLDWNFSDELLDVFYTYKKEHDKNIVKRSAAGAYHVEDSEGEEEAEIHYIKMKKGTTKHGIRKKRTKLPVCKYCHEKGHKVTACPSPNTPVCSNCGIKGHTSEVCYRNQSKPQSSSPAKKESPSNQKQSSS